MTEPTRSACPADRGRGGASQETRWSLENAPVELLVQGEQEDHRHVHPKRGQHNVCNHMALASRAGCLGFVGIHYRSILHRLPRRRKSRKTPAGAPSVFYTMRHESLRIGCPGRARLPPRRNHRSRMRLGRSLHSYARINEVLSSWKPAPPPSQPAPARGSARSRRAVPGETADAGAQTPCNCAASA